MESGNLRGEERHNYGIALLRMLMCFEVILSHFWAEGRTRHVPPLNELLGVHVPVFMFLSFYLTEKTFLEKSPEKAWKRLRRLAVPHVAWAFVYWAAQEAALRAFGVNMGGGIRALAWQLATGHSGSLNSAMWFQTNLIALTALFFLMFRLLPAEKGMALAYGMTLAALAAQYSGLNLRLFGSLRFELKYPLGRFCEMVPYATLGFFCARHAVFERARIVRAASILLFGAAGLLLTRYTVVAPAAGFGYSRNNAIPLAFSLVAFAALLPLERLPRTIKRVMRFASRYTLGIYCMHMLIGKTLRVLLPKLGIGMGGIRSCALIYAVGFAVSLALSRISARRLGQLVD